MGRGVHLACGSSNSYVCNNTGAKVCRPNLLSFPLDKHLAVCRGGGDHLHSRASAHMMRWTVNSDQYRLHDVNEAANRRLSQRRDTFNGLRDGFILRTPEISENIPSTL